MNTFEVVIGLEIHAQLQTKTKAFCFVPAIFGDKENTQVGPVSGGLPGALPVLNKEAVHLAIRAGLALGCQINEKSVFSRKNYFYPDLPKGYQISQFDEPLCGIGQIEVEVEGSKKTIGIQRIHMEEDAGKSMHLAATSLVNLNRSGTPLVEIVSQPDIRNAAEAVAYLKKIHAILVFAGVSDGNMEEGNFRCDVNLSVRPLGQKEFGTRTEIKNLNSFRFIEKAIEFESARQIATVSSGGKVIQETRGWDSAAGKTFSQRTKEEAHDYRYFPDPDLPPLLLTPEFIEQIRSEMPELPDAKRERFEKEYSLNSSNAELLTASKDVAAYFEECVAAGATPKAAASWVLSELLREIKEVEGADIAQSPISPQQIAELIALIEKGTISGKIAKTVFAEMFVSRKSPKQIVEEKGLVQVLDEAAIQAWIQQVITENPSIVAEYKAGKEKVFAFLVGQVMKLSKGKANPAVLGDKLKAALKGT
ncbi:MAG: Asp-tRNA(Asn)/Glu-tRNA(Gln) amidotransferase subunit GatB [Bdellovibrionota bacterium]